MTSREFRLRSLSTPARCLVAAFLLAVAAGMAAAHVNLHLQHAGRDGKPGLSYDDVVAAFHGNPDRTLLAAKIDGGSMERYVPRPVDQLALLEWAAAGAEEPAFEPAKEVLDRQCVRCHHPAGEMASVPFAPSRRAGSEHAMVTNVTGPDPGTSLPTLARSSHAHLFGMGTLFALTGLIVLGTDLRARWKALLAVLPYVAMFMDIGCWWLARLAPEFALGVVGGGALMGLAVAAQVGRSVFELITPTISS